MKILFVDDDDDIRQVVRGRLEELGHDVLLAADGREGWDAYEKNRPEIVITDWLMPEVSGVDLCRRIRAAKHVRYTYLIIVTAIDRKTGFLPGMEAGADDFITKPLDITELEVRLLVAERILDLQHHVAHLEGMLPICPECKKIRDDREEWHALESFVGERSEANFSHGICPECFETIMKPQIEEIKNR